MFMLHRAEMEMEIVHFDCRDKVLTYAVIAALEPPGTRRGILGGLERYDPRPQEIFRLFFEKRRMETKLWTSRP